MNDACVQTQFENCIQKHYPALRSVIVRRMRYDMELADELMQEILAIAWQKKQHLLAQTDDIQRKTLYAFARNRWKTVMVRNGRYKRSELSLEDVVFEDGSARYEAEESYIGRLDRQKMVNLIHAQIVDSRQLEVHEKRALLLHLGWHTPLRNTHQCGDSALSIEEITGALQREFGRKETPASVRMCLHRAKAKVMERMKDIM